MNAKAAWIVLFSVMLSGCVVGQKLDMDYTAAAVEVTEPNRVKIDVVDERPYVVSGDKDPWFIGKYRAGFGNPWDVTTEDNVPLAQVLAADLEEALQGLGFGSDAASPDRVLAVQIRDWNFDGYQNGRFWYALDVEVRGSDGSVIESLTLEDNREITGSFWTGAKGGFEKEMPALYRSVVDAVVTRNDKVLAALRS